MGSTFRRQPDHETPLRDFPPVYESTCLSLSSRLSSFFAPSNLQKLQQRKNAGARPPSGPPHVYQSILASAPSVTSISQRRRWRRSHLRGRIHPAAHLRTSVNMCGGSSPPAHVSSFCSSTFVSFAAVFFLSSVFFISLLRVFSAATWQNFKTLQNFKRKKHLKPAFGSS